MEEGKKLFFHVTEVEGGDVLVQGDEVEFVVATNKRNGKHSACCVRKIRYVLRGSKNLKILRTSYLEAPKGCVPALQ